MSEGGPLSAEEFQSWIPAAQALEWLVRQRDDYTGASAAIVKRVKDGLIKSAAEALKEKGWQEPRQRIRLPAHWWKVGVHDYAGSPLWKIEGDADFVDITNAHSRYERKYEYRAYGVRFEPVDILAPLAVERAVAASYNPRPVGSFEEIAPELAPYRPAPLTDHLGPNAATILTAPIDPAAEGAPGLTEAEWVKYLQGVHQDPGMTAEEFEALTWRLSRRRGQGPYLSPNAGPSKTSRGHVPEASRAPETGKVAYATNAQVDAWFNALSPEERELSVRNLHRKANEDLHPLRVVRPQVEPFRRGKVRGRKRRG